MNSEIERDLLIVEGYLNSRLTRDEFWQKVHEAMKRIREELTRPNS